jgi:tRNA U38,U39,U40 pseudouridine synthase TruA
MCERDVGDSRYGSIVVRRVVPVPCDFDARYSSIWKRYVYYVRSCYIYDRDTTLPIGRDGGGGGGGGGVGSATMNVDVPFAWARHSWRVNRYLDIDAMTRAASMISDVEHNFEWLSVYQRGEVRDTHRTVRLSVEGLMTTTTTTTTTTTSVNGNDDEPYFLRRHNDGGGDDDDGTTMDVYKIVCTCDFFLYKMMRRIVGTLVAVGGGDASLDMLRMCLDEYDNCRRRCVDDNDDDDDARIKEKKGNMFTVPPKLLYTAPAKGLCLDHIEYDIPI